MPESRDHRGVSFCVQGSYMAAMFLLFGKEPVLVSATSGSRWVRFTYPNEPFDEMLRLQRQLTEDPDLLISAAKFLAAIRRIWGLTTAHTRVQMATERLEAGRPQPWDPTAPSVPTAPEVAK